MNGVIVTLAGLLSAGFWLVMLIITGFSLIVVCVGLLAMLYTLGQTQPSHQTLRHH